MMASVRRIVGALLLFFGVVLHVWIAYNLVVEMSPHFVDRGLRGALLIAFGTTFVGWRWVRNRTAFDGTNGKIGEGPREVGTPEVEAAYPGVLCRRCQVVRLLTVRDGGLWCRLCHEWVVPPAQTRQEP